MLGLGKAADGNFGCRHLGFPQSTFYAGRRSLLRLRPQRVIHILVVVQPHSQQCAADRAHRPAVYTPDAVLLNAFMKTEPAGKADEVSRNGNVLPFFHLPKYVVIRLFPRVRLPQRRAEFVVRRASAVIVKLLI